MNGGQQVRRSLMALAGAVALTLTAWLAPGVEQAGRSDSGPARSRDAHDFQMVAAPAGEAVGNPATQFRGRYQAQLGEARQLK